MRSDNATGDALPTASAEDQRRPATACGYGERRSVRRTAVFSRPCGRRCTQGCRRGHPEWAIATLDEWLANIPITERCRLPTATAALPRLASQGKLDTALC